jgi:hypothetical protein
MSYPTVNSRLNEILLAMGHGDRVKVPEAPEPLPMGADQKKEILSQVREGTLTAAQAEQLLRGRA